MCDLEILFYYGYRVTLLDGKAEVYRMDSDDAEISFPNSKEYQAQFIESIEELAEGLAELFEEENGKEWA
jgi:hypothetical protein